MMHSGIKNFLFLDFVELELVHDFAVHMNCSYSCVCIHISLYVYFLCMYTKFPLKQNKHIFKKKAASSTRAYLSSFAKISIPFNANV